MSRAARLYRAFLTLDEREGGTLAVALFMVPFAIWVAARILYATSLVAFIPDWLPFGTVRGLCLAAVVAREVAFGSWDRRAFVGLCATGAMCLAAYQAGNLVIFDSLVFVFCARNVPFDKLALLSMALLAALVAVVLACWATGVVPDAVVMRESAGVQRHHLGFAHPNTCPGICLFIFCTWAYMRDDKYNALDMLAGLAASAALFALTNARVSCGMMAVVAVSALAVKHLPDRLFLSRGAAVLLVGSVALFAAASIALTALYDPSVGWMSSLNIALSKRLSLGHAALERYGIPLTGQKVDSGLARAYDLVAGTWVTSGRPADTIVDCAYVRLLVSCGLPFMALAITLCTLACLRAYRRRDWVLLVVVATMAAHSTIETYAPYLQFDVFLFLLGGLFARARRMPAHASGS